MWNDLWGTRGPETIFDKRTFLLPTSLAKLLSCRSLDVFHKETKCSKWRGPPMRRWISNLDSMCTTTSCLHLHLHTLMSLDCFENFAIIKRSVIYVLHQWVPIGNRLFIIQQTGAKRDARGRHDTQVISFSHRTEALEKLLRSTITLKNKKKRKETTASPVNHKPA